jgi:hypothetical protein
MLNILVIRFIFRPRAIHMDKLVHYTTKIPPPPPKKVSFFRAKTFRTAFLKSWNWFRKYDAISKTTWKWHMHPVFTSGFDLGLHGCFFEANCCFLVACSFLYCFQSVVKICARKIYIILAKGFLEKGSIFRYFEQANFVASFGINANAAGWFTS